MSRVLADADPTSSAGNLRQMLTDPGASVAYQEVLARLPAGTLVVLPEQPNVAMLLRTEELLPWSPAGYGHPLHVQLDRQVTDLTPSAKVNALQAGCVPEVAASQ